jgi:hypothetical protein
MKTSCRVPSAIVIAAIAAVAVSPAARASDHLDTPTVIADPAADIGDLYAWMSPDGRRLNLVMDIVGKRFSDQIAYVFHIDSGRRFGKTAMTTTLDCRFDRTGRIRCDTQNDSAAGNPDDPTGIESTRGRFRVFAGMRDDPFANNVRGTRQAYDVAERALKAGAVKDAAGCPGFGADIAGEMRDRWRHTDGGPAMNFLAGWSTAALVVSIDVDAVDRGGPLLGVWAGTYAHAGKDGDRGIRSGARLDRIGRTLTGNAMIGLFAAEEAAGQRKEQYNRAASKDWNTFAPDIRRTLGLYDGFDGICGNQWLAASKAAADRYGALARLLADDRLWVDSRHTACRRHLAVETGENESSSDCGGRTPDSDAIEVYRSLLINGTRTGVDDGVAQDDQSHSSVQFPFLAEP